ncbi:MAG: response regulator [Elusimicrobiales bacterium]
MPENFTLLVMTAVPDDSGFPERTLKAAGFKPSILTARDRAELERTLAERRCDIILSDYPPPSLTGKEVVELAARLSPGTPVILAAAPASGETASELLGSGAADYIHKDRPDRLSFAVGRLLAEKERKELERRACRTGKMEALGRMAGIIAHDFNNILGAIEGYATLLLKALPSGDPARSDIEEIRKSEQRGAALTKQLIAFSRGRVLRKAPVELTALLSDTAKRLSGEGLTVEVRAAPDLKPIWGDAEQLEQAFINLLANARDAMPGGGRIEISAANAVVSGARNNCPEPAKTGGEFIMFSVTDSGAGVPESAFDRLFEPFFTTKAKGKGAGLGLSTVYGIVRQHNGWIEASGRKEGTGAVFTVYLPVAPTAIAAPGEAPGGMPGRGERVLVVEDDETLRKLTVRMLKETGYEPAGAGTASEALKLLSDGDRDFGIVFTDITLSDRNGTGLINDLKNAAPKAALILTAGSLNDQDVIALIKDKGYPFIPKPYSIETILKTFKTPRASEKPD